MNQTVSPGICFRSALKQEKPLQIAGVINAYAAKLAAREGFKALYLSGAGVANASLGLPDLGMTTLNDVCEDIRRITAATDLPLLVDADTGWGSAFMISRCMRELIRAGAAACHIEDQVQAKRCGHRPNKALVSCKEMCDRIKAAVDGRSDPGFVIMARTDAYANEGLQAAIGRAQAYLEVGADMIFAEALQTLEDFKAFTQALNAPVLANITEFGKTPLFTLVELKHAGVSMALYPLSAFRAMSRAAETVYAGIRQQGTQQQLLQSMQTREELYQALEYYRYEQMLDTLFSDQS